GVPLRHAGVEDGDDARVSHARRELGLVPQAARVALRREVPREDDLERDLAVQLEVARAVDDAHAAATELGEELEPAEAAPDGETREPRRLEGGAEAVRQFVGPGHAGSLVRARRARRGLR